MNIKMTIEGEAEYVCREARAFADALFPRVDEITLTLMRRAARHYEQYPEMAERKIQTIKTIRTVFGCSLKEAKDIVEGTYV